MRTLPLLAFLALAGCGGGQSPVENTADQLEEAAAQSDATAAQVLENAADAVRDQNAVMPMGAPGSAAQQAMAEAGNAQAATVARPQTGQQAPSQPPLGAKPHRPGDPVPPPKIRPEG